MVKRVSKIKLGNMSYTQKSNNIDFLSLKSKFGPKMMMKTIINLTHVDGAGRRKDVAGRREIRLFSATSCDV